MNSEKWLRKHLETIAATTDDIDLEIIVVDNGSRDNSIETTLEVCPDLILLPQATQRRLCPGEQYRHGEGRGHVHETGKVPQMSPWYIDFERKRGWFEALCDFEVKEASFVYSSFPSGQHRSCGVAAVILE